MASKQGNNPIILELALAQIFFAALACQCVKKNLFWRLIIKIVLL